MPENTDLRPFISLLTEGETLPGSPGFPAVRCNTWAFKPVRPDFTTFTSARTGTPFKFPFPDRTFLSARDFRGFDSFAVCPDLAAARNYSYNTGPFLLVAFDSLDALTRTDPDGKIRVPRLVVVAVKDPARLIIGSGGRLDLSRANLEGMNLKGASLPGSNLRDARLARASLEGANLTGADLTGAKLSRANMKEASLSRASLTEANGVRVSFKNADLAGADLTQGVFSHAFFGGADLTGANLAGANLTYADFTGARGRPQNTGAARLEGAVNVPEEFTRRLQVPSNLTEIAAALRAAGVEFDEAPVQAPVQGGGPF